MNNFSNTDGTLLIKRLDRIPVWPYPRFYAVIVGLGFFFCFYDTLSIGLVLPKIQQVFNVTLSTSMWTVTTSLIGYIIGSFFFSRLSDYYGRYLHLMLSVICFTLGSLISAIAINFDVLVFSRFITGLGMGSEIVAVIAYMGEMAPTKVRGSATSLAVFYGMVGFAIVPFIAWGLVPHFEAGWRILFLLGALGGVVIAFLCHRLPNSPRWLIGKGRLTEAEAIIKSAENFAVTKFGINLTADPLGETSTALVNIESQQQGSSLRFMLQPIYIKRVLLFTFLWFSYYIGNYAWLTLVPDLLVNEGFSIAKSISFVSIASLGFIIGSYISKCICDKFERKHIAIVTTFCWAIILFLIGWFPTPHTIMLGGLAATISIAVLIPVLYIYTGENFPTSIRATCLSITDGLGHLGGAFCGQIIFYFSQLFTGESHAFSVNLSIMALSGLITSVLLFWGEKLNTKGLVE